MINLVTNYNLLFIIVTILVTNNFQSCKLIFKLIIIMTNYFLFLKLISNSRFSYSDILYLNTYYVKRYLEKNNNNIFKFITKFLNRINVKNIHKFRQC